MPHPVKNYSPTREEQKPRPAAAGEPSLHMVSQPHRSAPTVDHSFFRGVFHAFLFEAIAAAMLFGVWEMISHLF